MASLLFTKQDSGTYVAYATVRSRFTISLVRKEHGEVRIFVSSTEGGTYSPFKIPAFKANESLAVEREFSFDSVSSNAPKYLKIVSWAEMETATIVESGVINGVIDNQAQVNQIQDIVSKLDGTNDDTPDIIDTIPEIKEALKNFRPGGDDVRTTIEKETAVADQDAVSGLFGQQQ